MADKRAKPDFLLSLKLREKLCWGPIPLAGTSPFCCVLAWPSQGLQPRMLHSTALCPSPRLRADNSQEISDRQWHLKGIFLSNVLGFPTMVCFHFKMLFCQIHLASAQGQCLLHTSCCRGLCGRALPFLPRGGAEHPEGV